MTGVKTKIAPKIVTLGRKTPMSVAASERRSWCKEPSFYPPIEEVFPPPRPRASLAALNARQPFLPIHTAATPSLALLRPLTRLSSQPDQGCVRIRVHFVTALGHHHPSL